MCPAALRPEEEGDGQFPTPDEFPAKEGDVSISSLVQTELMEVARLLMKITRSGTGGFEDETKVEAKEARESPDVQLEGVAETGNDMKKSQKWSDVTTITKQDGAK